MTEMTLDLNDVELRMLFNQFDKEGNGEINYEEFLLGVREPMNEKRRKLVEVAFYILDTDRSG